MKKVLYRAFIIIICLATLVSLSIIGCKNESIDKTTTETMLAIERTMFIVYTYESFRQMAENKDYLISPGKGHTLGFANKSAEDFFCQNLQENLLYHAKLAGYKKEDIYIVNNQYNVDLTKSNADLMLKKGPDVFLEFGIEPKSNETIGKKFEEAGIPIITICTPMASKPLVEPDKEKINYLLDNETIKLIEKKWGTKDKVDLIIFAVSKFGEFVSEENRNFLKDLRDKYDDKVEEIIVEYDTENTMKDSSQIATSETLAIHPNIKNVVLYSSDTSLLMGAIAAINSFGLKRENTIFVISSYNKVIQDMIKKDLIDISISLLPEKYGEYLIPSALTLTHGKTIPNKILVDCEVITKENIN